jgi:hypothetical protein
MPSYASVCLAHRNSTNHSEVPQSHPGHSGSNEIDNHLDTICAGPNWRLLELSGKYSFFSDYQLKPIIPIAECETTYTCPSGGDAVVLVADQVLWFGNKLHCLLIKDLYPLCIKVPSMPQYALKPLSYYTVL